MQKVQVCTSVCDAGPMVPAGLGHWTPREPLPQAHLDALFHRQSTKGNLYTYIKYYFIFLVYKSGDTADVD